MTTKEILHEIEESGGLNFIALRRAYNYDVARCRYKKSFKTWLTGWIRHRFGTSYYVAHKVSGYFY